MLYRNQLLTILVLLISMQISANSQAAPTLHDWPGSDAPDNVTQVASARLSGLWATVSGKSGPIGIFDIRGRLVHQLAPEEIAAAAPDPGMKPDDLSIRGLCFTDSGRQLFLVVSGGATSEGGAVLALNLNTKVLRVFAQLDSLAVAERCGMAHWKGRLYVGAPGQLLVFDATRNAKSAEVAERISFPAPLPIHSLTVDALGDHLYAASREAVYSLALTAERPRPRVVSTGERFQSLTFARSYGGEGNEGLYALNGNGEIVVAPATGLRTGGPVAFSPYAQPPSDAFDIASTACGRILLGGSVPKVLTDSSDTRLGFEEWVRDEFKQYVLMNKSILWPDGEPEGWVKMSAASALHKRFPPCGSVAAGMTTFMLLMADRILDDPDAQGQVRSILKRYAGMHADGIAPHKNIDGQFVDFAEPDTGKGTWGAFANPQCYGIMFILAAADRARAFYPDDKEIAEATERIIAPVQRMADYVEPTGAVYFWGDEYGPFPGAAYGPYNETALFAEIAAAQDPLSTHIYADILHRREDVIASWDGSLLVDGTFLPDEPVMAKWLTVFVHHYAMTIQDNWRQGEGWRREFANYYSHFCAWTDDNAPPYLTVFSAGEAPPGMTDTGYSPDTLDTHPGNVIHFPAVLGFSMLGDPAPAVGAYLAYREGRRIKMLGTDQLSGAEVLVRYSPEIPDFVPASHSQVDYHFGLMGLAELIEPGVVDAVCAGHFYEESLQVGATEDGRVRLDYSRLTPRRVLASNDGGAWISFGLHESPYIFQSGERYSHYQVVDPEGEVLLTYDSDAPLGETRQTIDVSHDFPETTYIVRATTPQRNSSEPVRAHLRVQWDSDADAGNGVLTVEMTQVAAPAHPCNELRLDVQKPEGVTHLHLSGMADEGGLGNLSVVRIGALLPFANAGFEQGDMSGWLAGGNSTVSVVSAEQKGLSGKHALQMSMPPGEEMQLHWAQHDLDISGDPPGTRYIVRADAVSDRLEFAHGVLEIRIQKNDSDAFDSKRRFFSNKAKTPNGTFELVRTMRKREKDETVLRAIIVMTSPAGSTPSPTESIRFDGLRVHKVFPQAWKR